MVQTDTNDLSGFRYNVRSAYVYNPVKINFPSNFSLSRNLGFSDNLGFLDNFGLSTKEVVASDCMVGSPYELITCTEVDFVLRCFKSVYYF